MRNRPWRHSANDGRGGRKVYVDGKFVDHVWYADERRGIVLYCPATKNAGMRRCLRTGRYKLSAMRGQVKVVPDVPAIDPNAVANVSALVRAWKSMLESVHGSL